MQSSENQAKNHMYDYPTTQELSVNQAVAAGRSIVVSYRFNARPHGSNRSICLR
jgi:hypothetical protein